MRLCLTSSFDSFPLLICSWYQILAVEINSSQERYCYQYKYRIENENLKVLLDNLFCTGVHFFFGRGRRGKCKRMLSSYLQVFVIKCYWQLDSLCVVFLHVLIADCGNVIKNYVSPFPVRPENIFTENKVKLNNNLMTSSFYYLFLLLILITIFHSSSKKLFIFLWFNGV